MSISTPRAQAYLLPYVQWHDRYQAYYLEGLRQHCEAAGGSLEINSPARAPKVVGVLRYIKDAGYLRRRGVEWLEGPMDRIGEALGGPSDGPSPFFHPHVGQYLITASTGRELRVCVDSADASQISSPELSRWSDVYFKTNYWPSLSHPANVEPLVNGDPFMLGYEDALRRRRNTPRDVDLCFIARVWGGRDGSEGVEHNLRLLEAVSRARCRKRVLAILVAGDVEHISRRLERSKIPWTTKTIRAGQLWEVTSRARLNLLRLGMHHCMPWRVIGSLALGTCIVLDRRPHSVWPKPLEEDVNYLSLGLEVSPDQPVAHEDAYEQVPDRIESWLEQAQLLEGMAHENEAYFDRFAEPRRVGEHIFRRVEESSAVDRATSRRAATDD